MGKLAGKVAVVTGAASGMGKAIAEMYAKEGAKVVLADYNLAGAQTATDAIVANGGKAVAVKADVSNSHDITHMIDTAISEYGTLDILVNNAGIMDGFEPVGEITDEKWDHIFEVNTKGVMRAMREAINYWLDNNQAGNIINIISTGGLNGAHAGVAYGASKHAVVALTKNSAFMYAQKNIRVNGIAPGAVDTNIGSSITDMSEFGFSRAKIAHGVIPSTGKAEDIGAVAVFLASDDTSFVNGAIIVADGGWTAAF
ncbi:MULTISPECIES: glucose 1-dehydrogenase [unclassified Jeotgalibaca]|uniref:glucose 1-dehydrogenase n=1 Tax=unclassified Jeotgalibaca TaxID=2621505 RepID=UPI003FD11F6F